MLTTDQATGALRDAVDAGTTALIHYERGGYDEHECDDWHDGECSRCGVSAATLLRASKSFTCTQKVPSGDYRDRAEAVIAAALPHIYQAMLDAVETEET